MARVVTTCQQLESVVVMTCFLTVIAGLDLPAVVLHKTSTPVARVHGTCQQLESVVAMTCFLLVITGVNTISSVFWVLLLIKFVLIKKRVFYPLYPFVRLGFKLSTGQPFKTAPKVFSDRQYILIFKVQTSDRNCPEIRDNLRQRQTVFSIGRLVLKKNVFLRGRTR